MSKRINKDIRKKVACALVTTMVIGSSCNLASADNGFDNANYKDIGYVSVVGEVGVKGNAGFISTGEGDAGGKSYGLSQFTSKAGGASANGFVKWLKKNYPQMGNNFNGVGRAGSSSFDNAWKKTYNENKDDFARVQMEYTGMNYVDPFVAKAKSEFGIDFKSTRALLELAYSTTVQFGVNGTMQICRNAGINSNMSEVEILESATKEKINSVGTYKFLGCSQNVRSGVRKRFSRELKEFKDITEGIANIEGSGAITLDDLVNGNTNNTSPSLDDLVNGETNNTGSSLDDLVNGETNNTDSSLDDLVNGDTDNTDSSLDNLVNGETNNTDSSLDDLVNGDTDSTDKESTTEEDNKEEVDNNEPTLDDSVNGEPSEDNNEETNTDNTDVEAPTENEPNSDKEATLDDLVNGNDAEKDNVDLDENTQDSSDEDTNSSVEEEPAQDKEEQTKDETVQEDKEDKEELAKEESTQEPSLDDLVNEDSSEEPNKVEDNSSNEAQEDASDDKSTEDDKEDVTKDSEDEVENTTPAETTVNAEKVLSLEEKLENNMFGKLFKMTKEIMENENGIDGVRAMYDLV